MNLQAKLALVRRIAHSALSSNAKNLGVVLALAIVERRNSVRLTSETLAERTGLTGRTLERASTELARSGLLERRITGRATLWLAPVVVKSSEIRGAATYGGSAPSPVAGRQREYRQRKRKERDPYDPSPFGRTAEEREKYSIWREVLRREKAGQATAKHATTTATPGACSQQAAGQPRRARHRQPGPSGQPKSDDSTGSGGDTQEPVKCGVDDDGHIRGV